MPARRDLERILILGSGPIVIGQACEFDYSGTQACRALRKLGYDVVLVNSNPATIMTDPDVATRTYVEPITPEFCSRVIERERPGALLPTLGGQTALNVSIELAESGILDRYGVELIGASTSAIRRAEDREQFKAAVGEAGLPLPRSQQIGTVNEALAVAEELGYPIIVRPSFTMGGGGSGLAREPEALAAIAARGIEQSPIGQVLVEESVLGWKEYELEVMRDRADNVVVICSIENLDPMGVHTGDSITVAPAQTLTDRCYQAMRDAAIRVIRAIGVETGGSNIQFAVDPADGRMVVIEMNPRVSRSSALASKATGYPIAKVAAMLAVGMTLDEIPNDITGTTPAAFEPVLDYCVVKIPRFASDKFQVCDPVLGTQMQSVGEVMAVGRTFEEALMKGLRSLEVEEARGLTLGADVPPAGGQRRAVAGDEHWRAIGVPHVGRLFAIGAALAAGRTVDEAAAESRIDPWFLEAIRGLVVLERDFRRQLELESWPPPAHLWRLMKESGFSDEQLGRMSCRSEAEVRAARESVGVRPTMKAVDTCAAEFAARTPYFYSTYEEEDEAEHDSRPAVVILGSGPNRIGQGIEFDYCCVQAAMALRDAGYRVVMVNSNPETVSTDYDISDRLYFEPLVLENVLEIVEREEPLGVIVQLGGQTPLGLAAPLDACGVRILGTPLDAIDRAENRERMKQLAKELGLLYPRSQAVVGDDEAFAAAERLGYPLLVRPSYVLGGRGMRLVVDAEALRVLFRDRTVEISAARPLMLDEFLEDAIEIDVDAVADGETVLVGPVMEHIEEAGVHSGDSTCVTPPYSIGKEMEGQLREHTRQLARALGVCGLINVQFALKGERVYVLEVNPRASRTIPFVSKATGVPMARLAARAMVGESLADQGQTGDFEPRAICVKKPVYPFARFPGEDALLGPEMKSTGEVMGIDADLGRAFAKAMIADGGELPRSGGVFLSVRDRDKRAVAFIARRLHELGFELLATAGTARLLRMNGVPARRVYKVREEGGPNAVDLIRTGAIQLVINTPLGRPSRYDERAIRLAALEHGVLTLTTVPGAAAAVCAIEAARTGGLAVIPLQEHLLAAPV